ncbi:hypothetical protein VPH35_018881 [Triticum aestivum]
MSTPSPLSGTSMTTSPTSRRCPSTFTSTARPGPARGGPPGWCRWRSHSGTRSARWRSPSGFHETTKAITLGGGAVGWVDLWRGILVCNVFDEKPVLRDVPLPLPARGNWEIYHRCGPYFARDIAVSPQKDVIKYVEVEICLPRKPTTTKTTETCHPPEPESYLEWFRQQQHEDEDDDDDDEDVGGWKATTWSLPVPIASWENWHFDYTVDVDDITVNPLHCNLLPRQLQPTEAQALLPGLITAFPIMSMDDDLVYLLSKASPKDQMQVVIAVDVRRKMLLGVAKLVTGKDFTFMRTCTSEISKYINNKSSGDVSKASASLSAASRGVADKQTEGLMQKFTSRQCPGENSKERQKLFEYLRSRRS